MRGRTRFLFFILASFLFVFCGLPFFVLIYRSFTVEGVLSLDHLRSVMGQSSTWTAFKNTLLVSSGTTVLSLLIAVPLAWILARTNIHFARRFRTLFCLPYAIPPFVGAIAWINLANPTSGLLNVWGLSLNVYSLGGLIWVESTFLYTYVLVLLLSSLDRMDPSLEEAARLSGAGPARIFFQITLPLLKPTLLSGGLLVFLATAASFGVPALIGNPARIYLMTTKIYTELKMGSLDGVFRAGTLSFILMLAAIALVSLSEWVAKHNRFSTLTGKTARPSVIDLGEARLLVELILVVLLGLVFLLPCGTILVSALSVTPGKWTLDNLGVEHFTHLLFEMHEVSRSLWNSTLLALGTALFCVVLGFLVAFTIVKTKIRGRTFLAILTGLPYAIPGSVVALAVLLTFGRRFDVFGWEISLYGTLGMIGLAYAIKLINFSVRTMSDGLGQVDNCLGEAARVAGASPLLAMTTVWFPLMKPAVVASFFLVFLPAFSELTMTVLLFGPGTETVGTLLFQLQSYANPSGASVLALLIVIIAISCNSLVKFFSKGKFGL